MISKNADIPTVCWQLARGFYSKANRIDRDSSINAQAVNLLLNFTAEWGILCLNGADRYAEY